MWLAVSRWQYIASADTTASVMSSVQQITQGGDLVALGRHRELADHRAGGLVERGYQVRRTVGGAGAAQGLAVDGDHPPPGQVCEWSNYLAHLDRAIWRYPRLVTTLRRAHTAAGDRPGRPM